MATELGSGPSATAFDIEDLLASVRRGAVRIPHFQRDFRWGRQDVTRLFDSIVKGYPIGSLLLWRRPAPAAQVQLGQIVVEAPATSSALWVVDGQQRIISLANALSDEGSEDPRFALAYDVAERRFVSLRAGDSPQAIPLPELLDLQRLLRRFAEYPDLARHLDTATEIAKAIRQYRIPGYIVDGTDVEVLEDIFDRMNNYGKQLSRAEVFSALTAGDEASAGAATTIRTISQDVEREFKFGRLDDDTVLHAILARRGPDVSRDIRNEFNDGRRLEFADEGRDAAFQKGEQAIHRAVAFIQQVAGVPHINFLPNRFLLVVLVRFLAHFPEPEARNHQLLRRWFWRSALQGLSGLGGSATVAMRQLCSHIHPGDETGSLQRLLSSAEGPETDRPDLARFRTNNAATKIVLCSWWASQPRSPGSGRPYDVADLYAVLAAKDASMEDAVPYVVRPRDLGERRSWAALRILMPEPGGSTTADSWFTHRPSQLTASAWDDVLASHTLSHEMVAALAQGDLLAFLDQRQSALIASMTRFVERVAERSFEDTPPLDQLDMDDDDPVAGDAA